MYKTIKELRKMEIEELEKLFVEVKTTFKALRLKAYENGLTTFKEEDELDLYMNRILHVLYGAALDNENLGSHYFLKENKIIKESVHNMKNIYDVYMERVNYINSNDIARFNGDELNHLWFTSDNHFGRDKTRVLTCRPFDSANEMDKEMIKNWNKFIKPNDIVYHLGDFGNLDILKKLNGRIRLIMGNHEKKVGLTVEDLLNAGFEQVFENSAIIEADGKLIHLIHEPSKHDPDMFNLFGHIHDLGFIKPYGLNVGVDVNHYRPMSYEKMMYYANLTGPGYKGEFTL